MLRTILTSVIRFGQRTRKSTSVENLAVSAFLQCGRRDRRASENALEILKTVCAQRTALIGGLGMASSSRKGSSPSRSRSPSPESCASTSSTDDIPTRFQQKARRASFSPVPEVDTDVDESKEKLKERRKSLANLMAIVQTSKKFSKFNEVKATTVPTVPLQRKNTPVGRNATLSMDMDAVPGMGRRRQSVGMIDIDLNKSYPPVSKTVGNGLDKVETPRGDSLVPGKEKLLSGRSSVTNSLSNASSLTSDVVAVLDDIVRISSPSSRRPSNSTSYTHTSSPVSSKYYPADSSAKPCKLYGGPPGNCQSRADSKTAGARLKRHLENMYSQMTTAERLLVEAERQKLNRSAAGKQPDK